MTKEMLKQFHYVGIEIKRLEEIVEVLESKELQAMRLSDMPRPDSKGINDTREILIDTKTRLSDIIQQHTNQMQKIINKISQITDSRYRILLYMRYIEAKTFETIAHEMNYSWRQIHNLHNEALKIIA